MKYSRCIFIGTTTIVDIPVNTTYVSVTQVSHANDRFYLGKNAMKIFRMNEIEFRSSGETCQRNLCFKWIA